MPCIQRDGLALHYRLHGAGPPLLLIHGLGSSGDDPTFQLEALGAARTLILPDLRGSGLGGKPRGPYTIATFAADLWALLDALAIESCDLLGFSLGGAVVLEMALTQPARADADAHAEHVDAPPAEKRRYAARMGAPWTVIEDSRHGTLFDASDAFNRAVLDFLVVGAEAAVVPSPARYQGSSLPS